MVGMMNGCCSGDGADSESRTTMGVGVDSERRATMIVRPDSEGQATLGEDR